ncbi:MAG: transposase [Crenarchaeota archaeon]|nr:transposase [Thermoproteota archaeon]
MEDINVFRRPAPNAGTTIKTQGAVFKCPRCGLIIDRQKNASINIWKTFLRMCGELWIPRKELTPMSPLMNPEEDKRMRLKNS